MALVTMTQHLQTLICRNMNFDWFCYVVNVRQLITWLKWVLTFLSRSVNILQVANATALTGFVEIHLFRPQITFEMSNLLISVPLYFFSTSLSLASKKKQLSITRNATAKKVAVTGERERLGIACPRCVQGVISRLGSINELSAGVQLTDWKQIDWEAINARTAHQLIARLNSVLLTNWNRTSSNNRRDEFPSFLPSLRASPPRVLSHFCIAKRRPVQHHLRAPPRYTYTWLLRAANWLTPYR